MQAICFARSVLIRGSLSLALEPVPVPDYPARLLPRLPAHSDRSRDSAMATGAADVGLWPS